MSKEMNNMIRTIILESLLLEDEKHVRQLFTNWATKKSGNPELALSLMDDFLKYQKKIKRDFSTFSSAEEMKKAIDQARTSETEKLKTSDAVKLFENSEIVVIAANSHEASCRYAAGTKWCTGSADTDEYWKRHNRTGTEFIWVFKNIKQDNPDYKLSLHIKWDKSYDWCNALNRCSSRTPKILEARSRYDFNYKDVLQKCFQYHDIRHQEKIKKQSETNTDTLKKEILSNFQSRLNEIRDQIINDFYSKFDDSINYRLEDFDDMDKEELDSIIDEATDFSDKNLEKVVSSCFSITKNDLENITTEELADIQEKYEDLTTIDELAEKFVSDYIFNNLYEITAEETEFIVDDFLNARGLS